MADIEKVINCLTDIEQIMICRQEICPREELQYWIELQEGVTDALAMLQEQEKAKVVFGRCKDGSFATECGNCGMYLDKAYSICPKCNKELDWNSNQN